MSCIFRFRVHIKGLYYKLVLKDKFLLEIWQCVTALCSLCPVFSGFRVHIKGLYYKLVLKDKFLLEIWQCVTALYSLCPVFSGLEYTSRDYITNWY